MFLGLSDVSQGAIFFLSYGIPSYNIVKHSQWLINTEVSTLKNITSQVRQSFFMIGPYVFFPPNDFVLGLSRVHEILFFTIKWFILYRMKYHLIVVSL